MSSVSKILGTTNDDGLQSLLENQDPGRALGALKRRRKEPRDLALLLSPGAAHVLEEIAETARNNTLARFGRVVKLYAPLYVSNHCSGRCPYCGFRADRKVPRRTLTMEEVLREAAVLRRKGLGHILLVSGDDPRRVDLNFLVEAVKHLKELAPSISVEVPPLEEEGYRALFDVGVDGVTLYQETYDREAYRALHKKGPKADFHHRLEALDRAGAVGMPKLTVGALLGLAPWRLEGLRLGLHAKYLQNTYWRSHLAIGLPRLHCVPDDFEIPHPHDDRSFAQLIVALRVFLEDADLVLSTREPPDLRERLLPLGITQMSAGSKTEPGGYSAPGSSADQFEISDHRSPSEVAARILDLGYDPVFKDWDRGFGGLHD